ncbi:IS1634 family transposase [Thermanaeromonas sp. C210]|uniref:IS1634 family transposase n=1 Tax=Thermanaeromonas sp. C210 TaxID=2731925 RepID=UPI00155B419C|nr:IS1634 family transposase [Thermanaeromonas sp. C210]GFN21973.1 transposase [Thermanaeromonas sp. C210]GFN22493.1 transposase [Thermanaeromonas sp. C210]GFN23935.1 transposase [Thermanaeromonas sp. C210]GFN24185.1 transposase [Thermanaeromonas sp. C210]
MFIKITKSRDHQYVQLVRSYRENGVVKHKVLLNLGRLDEIENNPSFQRLGKRLLELSKAREVTSLANFSEAQIKNWGYVVYRKIWNQFELPELLKEISAKHKVQFSLSDASFLMVVQHLLEPRSKLGTYNHQQRYASLPDVALNHLYRSLDLLSEHKELLEEEMFRKNRHLFNMKVDVVFYDVTTFSFASVKADTLRDFGFSKDGKYNEVQVVLGLLIDCEGRPIGYELFPGNTFDGKTLEAALEKLEKRFGLRRVIIVADRGINSKLNLKRIVERNYSYIFAARIKKMKKEITDMILDEDGYQEIKDDEEGEVLRYKVIEYINEFTAEGEKYQLPEKLIVTYSSRRAEKDRSDRERLIEKAQSLLESKAKIRASNKRGGKKYLKEVDCTGTWVLDEEAINWDQQFDGYYGIQTNEKEMSAKDILDAYHNLWRIEESFRVMKSTLEVRPVFHWTERRIKGHFVICFLAFLLERTLESKLRQAGENASPVEIREALNSLNFAEVEIEGETFFIKTKGTELSKKILRLMRIAPPANITRVEEFASRWQGQA